MSEFRQSGCRGGALSLPRGNGKSTLAAALALESWARAEPGAQVVLVSAGHRQAKRLFEIVLLMLRASMGSDYESATGRGRGATIRVVRSAGETRIEHLATGRTIEALAASADRAQGLAPTLGIFDEPSSTDPVGGEALWDALLTAAGKNAGARSLLIGTRPGSESHWYSRILERPERGMMVRSFVGPPGPEGFLSDGYLPCNPLARYHRPLRATLVAEAAAARTDKAAGERFEAWRLNRGVQVEDESLLLPAAIWRECSSDQLPGDPADPRTGPCIWGVDLGGSRSLSAIAAFWPVTGFGQVIAAAGGEPSPLLRGVQDGVGRLYRDAYEAGHLIVGPGRVPPVEGLLRTALDAFGRPTAIVADRYRDAELLDALQAAGVPACPVYYRGLKSTDAVEDCREFTRAAHAGALRIAQHALLSASVADARCTGLDPDRRLRPKSGMDPARRSGCRDDLAAALILAVSLGRRGRAAARRMTR